MPSSTLYELQADLLTGKPRESQPQKPVRTAPFDWSAPATHVHPFAVGAAAAGYAWFLLVCWVVFAGDREMVPTLLMITFISAVMLGLMALGGFARSTTPWMRNGRSWKEFLDGRVDTFTGPVSGRTVFAHLAGTSAVLAIGATLLGIIIAFSR